MLMNWKSCSDMLQILPLWHWTLEDLSCSLQWKLCSPVQTLAALVQSPVSAQKANVTITECKELFLHIAEFEFHCKEKQNKIMI